MLRFLQRRETGRNLRIGSGKYTIRSEEEETFLRYHKGGGVADNHSKKTKRIDSPRGDSAEHGEGDAFGVSHFREKAGSEQTRFRASSFIFNASLC